MDRQVVQPAGRPRPGVPLSPAIKTGGHVYCSGQLPVDPQTGQAVSDDIRAQTRLVLENLNHVLQAAGSSLARALKVTVYLTDISEFAAMNEVYREFFPTEPPARTTVGVAALARPGCRIEIDLVALA